MKNFNHLNAMTLGTMSVAMALTLVLASCQNDPSSSSTEVAEQQASAHYVPTRGAAELWGQNCSRCHNSRSPSSYSDDQWDVAALHMRTQARLTAEEYRKIRDFLKTSN